MSFVSQGNRPNYQSSIQPLAYPAQPYETSQHEHYIGAAVADLSTVTELDFEQPRLLWEKVFDEGAKERFVQNVAGHLGGVTIDEIVVKTLAILYVSPSPFLPLFLTNTLIVQRSDLRRYVRQDCEGIEARRRCSS